jgi:hypothetical protein
MPVWALLLSILLPIIYVLPTGFVYAMTGQAVRSHDSICLRKMFIISQISINLLAQIIPGTLLPGKPLANMFFKVLSVQTLGVSTSFVQDLKLGHYIKVPPRATFIGAHFPAFVRMLSAHSRSVQLVSTIISAFLQCLVKQWIFASVPDICSPNQKSHLTCPHNQVFFTASAIWCVLFSWAKRRCLHDSVFRSGALSAQVDNLVLARFITHSYMRLSGVPYFHFLSGSCNGGGQTRGPNT